MSTIPPPRDGDKLELLTILVAVLVLVGAAYGLTLEPIQ